MLAYESRHFGKRQAFIAADDSEVFELVSKLFVSLGGNLGRGSQRLHHIIPRVTGYGPVEFGSVVAHSCEIAALMGCAKENEKLCCFKHLLVAGVECCFDQGLLH